MKHLGNLIKNVIEDNKLVKKDIAEKAGISPTYLSTLFNQSTMDCQLYERICLAIGLPPSAGFDDPQNGSKILSDIYAKTVVGPATITIGETKALRELLAEKERLIQVLLATSGISTGTNTEQIR